MKKKIIGLLILLIAWIITIPLYVWTANLPNSLDYYLPATSLFLILIIATVAYPLLLIWKHYRKKFKNSSQDWLNRIKKIDKISVLLALVIAIILTLLLLSTYEHGETQKGIGWHLIEGLSDPYARPVLVSLFVASTFFFCLELIASYFAISILLMRKKSKM